MENLARKLHCNRVVMEYGTIESADGDSFFVATDAGPLEARRSINCLLEPRAGDMVLVSRDTFGRSYVLAILEREDGETASLVFGGDVEVKAPHGRLSLAAREGIHLVSGEDISLVSPDVSVHSMRGEANIQHFSFFGTLLQGQVDAIKLVAGTFDSVLERFSQKVKRCYRVVEELDQLRAGSMSYLAKKLLSLRGGYSVITAKKDVRIEGEHILMG